MKQYPTIPVQPTDGGDEVYVDENGTAWRRPTAWAYYAVCKALDEATTLLTRACVVIETVTPEVKRLQFTLNQVRNKVTPDSEIGQLLKDL